MSSLTTTTTTTTWSPSSNQLQFNFRFRKFPTPLFLVRARISNFHDRRLRIFCVNQDEAKTKSGSELERRRSGASWSTTLSSDWFGNSEVSVDSNQKQGIGGILGIGLASIFLVAGITFAALSIGNKSSSRPRQEMEPLTEEQEVSLASEEEYHKAEETKNDGKYDVQDDRNLENDHYPERNTSIEDDLPSSLESTEHVNQRTVVGYPDVETISGRERSVDLQNTLVVSKTDENLDVVGLNNSDTHTELLSTNDVQGILVATQEDHFHNTSLESTSSVIFPLSTDSQDPVSSANAKLDATPETQNLTRNDLGFDAGEDKGTSIGVSSSKENEPSGITSSVAQLSTGKQEMEDESDVFGGKSVFESQSPKNGFTSSGIPAPLLLSAALQVPPGKVLVPAAIDQTHAQALAALQVLKVIESDAQPGDLCTRREYARWLVSASSALSRNSISKVYPAMYIENVTELAFGDITPEDPDFTSIQGLAEAGLITSNLSRRDMLSSSEEDIGSLCFHPDSPLSRQDLVTWKMAIEKRQLPEASKKILHQLSGFIDIDRIDPDAWPALLADKYAGENGIVALAFGYTRLFQPDKPVTKGQAAIALATGEAADIVSEELARIEADSIAENAVAAHNALVAEVEKDINASFEKELLREREKIDGVQKMAQEARQEMERLRAEREEESTALMKERAAVESEMEVLSRLRHELEEQLQSLMGNKVEISFEKERIEKLRKETEEENQAIARLQYELEVERKALSMARKWAEDEAKRVQEYAKALEEARDRWVKQGVTVVVDEGLREEASAEVTWLNVGKQISVEETVEKAENLTDKLKIMASEVQGKSKEIINNIIEKIQLLVLAIKEWISKVGGYVQELPQNTAGFGATVKEGAKRVVGDCREGVEKLTQRFKT